MVISTIRHFVGVPVLGTAVPIGKRVIANELRYSRAEFFSFARHSSMTCTLAIRAQRLSILPFQSQARRAFGTSIQSILSEGEFFNREREKEAFTRMLEGEPQLSIITGPVNSGKTAFVLHLLKDLSHNTDRPILHFNLRGQSFSSVNELQASLEEGMRSWLDRFSEIAKRLKVNTERSGFTFELQLNHTSTLPTPVEKLNALFAAMNKQLPSHSWWSGKKSPILFIDEANRLRQLLKDEQGHTALTNMFEWFIKNTKEEHRFHVILASSDSFFHLWIAKFIGSSRLTSYVIGNLTKEEAEKFWQGRVITSINLPKKLSPPPFEDAYRVCGGNMFLLESYFRAYYQSDGRLQSSGFWLIRAEIAKLINALFKNGNDSPSSHKENGHPLWNRKQLISMIKQLTESQGGFLVYNDLCKKFGQKVVDAFIDYNLLHLRPSKDYAYDIPDAPIDRTIVTAETPASLIAMKEVLKDIKTRRL